MYELGTLYAVYADRCTFLVSKPKAISLRDNIDFSFRMTYKSF